MRDEKFLKRGGRDYLRAVSRDMFGFALRDRLVGFVAIPFGYRLSGAPQTRGRSDVRSCVLILRLLVTLSKVLHLAFGH